MTDEAKQEAEALARECAGAAHACHDPLDCLDVTERAAKRLIGILAPIVEAKREAENEVGQLQHVIDEQREEIEHQFASALLAHEAETRATVEAEWLDRARRYFYGVRDPKELLKGWSRDSVAADVVMHEVWKRNPKVVEAVRLCATLACDRCASGKPLRVPGGEFSNQMWTHPGASRFQRNCNADSIWKAFPGAVPVPAVEASEKESNG